jgi:hypothetical protein
MINMLKHANKKAIDNGHFKSNDDLDEKQVEEE